jgi:hypothetical protein
VALDSAGVAIAMEASVKDTHDIINLQLEHYRT